MWAAGFYETLEGLQGFNSTYYAGEVMSFATLEICARYAKSLVERFFMPQSTQPSSRHEELFPNHL